jgi:hypothetical protein
MFGNMLGKTASGSRYDGVVPNSEFFSIQPFDCIRLLFGNTRFPERR